MGKGKFIPDAEESEERPKGALQDPTISILNPGKFFGIDGVGFTKANELFVGRMAQLGFAASLIGEAVTGKGPLAQFNLETGIPLSEAEPLLLFSIVFFPSPPSTREPGSSWTRSKEGSRHGRPRRHRDFTIKNVH